MARTGLGHVDERVAAETAAARQDFTSQIGLLPNRWPGCRFGHAGRRPV